MRHWLIFAALFAVCALARASPSGDDGESVKPTRTTLKFQLELVFDRQDEIVERCRALKSPTRQFARRLGSPSIGCTAFNLDTGVCTVYTTPPVHMNQAHLFELLGHEVLHCPYGRYHEE